VRHSKIARWVAALGHERPIWGVPAMTASTPGSDGIAALRQAPPGPDLPLGACYPCPSHRLAKCSLSHTTGAAEMGQKHKPNFDQSARNRDRPAMEGRCPTTPLFPLWLVRF
jgi:hypothetical protein